MNTTIYRRRFLVGVLSTMALIGLAATAQAAIRFTLTSPGLPRFGEPRELVVNLDENSESTPIYAFDLAVGFDPAVIQVVDVTAGGEWGAPAWSVSQGVLRLAHAGAEPIVTGSNLFRIMVDTAVNATANASTEIEFNSILLNDNLIDATGSGLTVSVVGTPTYVNSVTIWPTTVTVRQGETFSFDTIVDTNGDPSVDWSFAGGFELGQILPTGVYVAPAELAESRQIVIRASSRIYPEAYDEATVLVLPVAGAVLAELWVTANPANRRYVEIHASVGSEPAAAVEIRVDGEVLAVTPVGSPVAAYRASYVAGPAAVSATVTADVDGILLTRTISFQRSLP